MAKNITLMGASYSDVPAVTLPQTGGGTARFDDASVTTATASDVASGKIFLASDGTITTGTASGGGGVDMPIFSVDTSTSPPTATCDKTFAEIYDANSTEAYLKMYYGQTLRQTYVGDIVSFTDGEYCTVTFFEYGRPSLALEYHSDGTFVFLNDVPSVTTLTATENGTYTDPDNRLYSSVVVNVSGGGASNFVTGTFRGTTAGEILEIDIPYTGSGYPLCAVIVPTGGLIGNNTFYNRTSRYTIGMLSIYKTYANTVPTYATSGTQNQCTVQTIYKNSSSSATSFTRTSVNNQVIFYGTSVDPSGATQSVLFANATRMRVKIKTDSYGFMDDIEYTYYVIYSE